MNDSFLIEKLFQQKQYRENLEAVEKSIRDAHKAAMERQFEELRLSAAERGTYISDEEYEQTRQEVIKTFGPGEHEVDGFTLKITESPLYVVENESAAVDCLARFFVNGYGLAGKALSISKINLNKFMDWLKEGYITEKDVWGVQEDTTYRVSIKQNDA